MGLEDRRHVPSIYVGESARSLQERAAEHWADAEKHKEDCHMLEHQAVAHPAETPVFNFRVVKSCKTSLERQVREAVRISMRGSVLNKKGMYNRCKLTRLVVDRDWDNKVWEESWQTGMLEVHQVGEERVVDVSKQKRTREDERGAKKARFDDDWVWGEELPCNEVRRQEFLRSKGEDPTWRRGGYRQTTLKVLSGNLLLARTILQEVVKTVLEEKYPDTNITENKPRITTPEVKQISASNKVTDISSASACCTESDSSIFNQNGLGTIAKKFGGVTIKSKTKSKFRKPVNKTIQPQIVRRPSKKRNFQDIRAFFDVSSDQCGPTHPKGGGEGGEVDSPAKRRKCLLTKTVTSEIICQD